MFVNIFADVILKIIQPLSFYQFFYIHDNLCLEITRISVLFGISDDNALQL